VSIPVSIVSIAFLESVMLMMADVLTAFRMLAKLELLISTLSFGSI
jgi:hypothetical protein